MTPDEERLDRKARSMARLKVEGVPTIDHLPAIEAEAEVLPRELEEMADRAMALLLVAGRAQGVTDERTATLATEYGVSDAFTPAERAYLADPAPPRQARVNFGWRYEAAATLLWALGYVGELRAPAAQYDGDLVAFMADRSRAAFLADARPRSMREILDEADLIYRYRWAIVDARCRGNPAPPGLDAGVAMERHHALNWLIRYDDDAAWDEVSLDT